jgi:ketosteroid isomerase-like protein
VTTGQTPPEQILRDGYAAWNSGDVETFLSTVHPDVVWIPSGVFPGMRPIYEGHEGIRGFWREFTGPWESLEIEVEEICVIAPDSVLARVRFHALGRDGLEVELEFTNHALLRDEKLFQFKGYSEWSEALADLGIADPREQNRS